MYLLNSLFDSYNNKHLEVTILVYWGVLLRTRGVFKLGTNVDWLVLKLLLHGLSPGFGQDCCQGPLTGVLLPQGHVNIVVRAGYGDTCKPLSFFALPPLFGEDKKEVWIGLTIHSTLYSLETQGSDIVFFLWCSPWELYVFRHLWCSPCDLHVVLFLWCSPGELSDPGSQFHCTVAWLRLTLFSSAAVLYNQTYRTFGDTNMTYWRAFNYWELILETNDT